MRDYPCYANVNARLLYLHLACLVDFTTYQTARSYRQLAYDLGMGLEAVRHAMRQLERDGLVATHVATHTATHPATHRTTQPTTHITLLRINENGAPNGAPNNTPDNTPDNTPRHTQDLNRIILEKKKLTHDRARECAEELAGTLKDTLEMDAAAAAAMVDAFCKRMELKGKKWADHADMVAHVIAWAEKRLSLPRKAPAAARRSDHAIRIEEYQRTAEEVKAKEKRQKDAEEVAKLRRWLTDAKKRGDNVLAEQLRSAIAEKSQIELQFKEP